MDAPKDLNNPSVKIPNDLENFLKRVNETETALLNEKARSQKIVKEYIEVRKKLTATLEDLQARHTDICFQHKELKGAYASLEAAIDEREGVLRRKIDILENQQGVLHQELEKARKAHQLAATEIQTLAQKAQKQGEENKTLKNDLQKTRSDAKKALEDAVTQQTRLRDNDHVEAKKQIQEIQNQLKASEDKRLASLSQLQKAVQRAKALEVELQRRSEFTLTQERHFKEELARKNEHIDQLKAQMLSLKQSQSEETKQSERLIVKLEGEKSKALEKALALQISRDQEMQSLKASLKLLEAQLIAAETLAAEKAVAEKAADEKRANEKSLAHNPATNPFDSPAYSAASALEIEPISLPKVATQSPPQGPSINPVVPPPFKASVPEAASVPKGDYAGTPSSKSLEEELLSWEIVSPPAFKGPQNLPDSEGPPPPRFRLLP